MRHAILQERMREANEHRERLIVDLQEMLVSLVQDIVDDRAMSDADKLRFMDLVSGKRFIEDPWRAVEACYAIPPSDRIHLYADEAGGYFADFARHFVRTSKVTGC